MEWNKCFLSLGGKLYIIHEYTKYIVIPDLTELKPSIKREGY